MIRPALLVAALLIASGCAPPGAANAPAPATGMMDTRGAEEPRLVEAFLQSAPPSMSV